MDYNMSERKRKILRALAQENIKTNEPVSSKDLAERYFTNVSSATIRNELASLEEQGVISKTHTSSGRVPTTLGFQMFIEEILPMVRPTAKEMAELKNRVASRSTQMEKLAKQTADVLSDVCQLPSVVLSGITNNAIIDSIKIFQITSSQCLVVVVTSEGIIKDIVLSSPDITAESCQDASNFLSKTLNGKTLDQIDYLSTCEQLNKFKTMVAMLVKVIEQNKRHTEVATSGQGKLLDRFEDPMNAKVLYNLMENETKLKELMQGDENQISVSVKNVDGAECAIVSCNLQSKGKPISVAVMGPARMDYEKVIKTIKGLSKIMDEEKP